MPISGRNERVSLTVARSRCASPPTRAHPALRTSRSLKNPQAWRHRKIRFCRPERRGRPHHSAASIRNHRRRAPCPSSASRREASAALAGNRMRWPNHIKKDWRGPRIKSVPEANYMFILGCDYTRVEIHAYIGGSLVSCLPTRKGAIVAACLSTTFSPRAPEVVLCGRGVRTSAVSAQFARQQTPIPVFVKSASSRWQYRGQFFIAGSFSSGPQFESFIAGSGRSVASVSHVVILKRSE